MVSLLHVIIAELVLIRKQFIELSANHTGVKAQLGHCGDDIRHFSPPHAPLPQIVFIKELQPLSSQCLWRTFMLNGKQTASQRLQTEEHLDLKKKTCS